MATWWMTSDEDLLFHILGFLPSEVGHLRSALRTCRTWRRAALRPDLPAWYHCDLRAFDALSGDGPALSGVRSAVARLFNHLYIYGATSSQVASHAAASSRWNCDTISRLLSTKTKLRTLNLSSCIVPSAIAARQMAACLPTTLCELTNSDGLDAVGQNALLTELLPKLGRLPQLSRLDLRGLLTVQTMCERAVASHPVMPIPLPSLKALAVGFHLFPRDPLGAECSLSFLLYQCRLSPQLQSIGCMVPAARLQAIDICCRECHEPLYQGLTSYLVHPPQQPHILYEIHTDQPPSPHLLPTDGDPTRLQCQRRCHGQLWVVDARSGFVHHLLDRRYAVACGPPQMGHPGLAISRTAVYSKASETLARTGMHAPDPFEDVFRIRRGALGAGM